MQNKLIKKVNKSCCFCVHRSWYIYFIYALPIFFLFLSDAFTAESIWQLQLVLNIIGKVESTWDLQQQSYETSITKNVFLASIPISFHPFQPFNFGRFPQLSSKKMMEFKKQETHNRIKEIFKLLWWQQNFHRNVQHRLIAALLPMCRLIEFLLFQ